MNSSSPVPRNAAAQALLLIDQLRFGWDRQLRLLDIPSLRLEGGQKLLLSGASGSGKSTLLNLIGGVLKPSHGKILVCGTDTTTLAPRHRDRFRAEHLGIIFQQFNLLPFLNVLDNVLLPLQFAPLRRSRAGRTPAERLKAAGELLLALGLEPSLWTQPAYRLSVGQQQRAAAARALIGEPGLILADEPTSALDPDNRDRFVELLLAQAGKVGSAVLMVSHDPSLAAHFIERIELKLLNRSAEVA